MFGSKVKDAKFKFDLGSKVKDQITGFEGVITCRSQWIHNYNVYSVNPTDLDDKGALRHSEQFDEPQLKLVKEKVVKASRRTGGPNDPVQRTNR